MVRIVATVLLLCLGLAVQAGEPGDPRAVGNAVKVYRKVYGKKPVAARDVGFLQFREFYYKTMDAYTQRFNDDEALQIKLSEPGGRRSKAARDLYKLIEPNGFTIVFSEGAPNVAEHPEFLFKTFASYVSPRLQVFLAMRQTEMKQGFTEDAGLRISFAHLAERVRSWEEYVERYPGSPLRSEAQAFYRLYRDTLITGLDNSPVFDFDGKARPEVLHVYLSYSRRFSDTPSGRLIGAWLRTIEANGRRRTPKMDTFLQQHGIQSMLGVHPPLR